MSDIPETLKTETHEIVSSSWKYTDGEDVPENEDLPLGNEAVKLPAVMLYADLADSTELAVRNIEQAAEVFKVYLRGVTRLIRNCTGEVRSFDGDRVMGVFTGKSKNTLAAKCGLQINWFFRHVLVPEFHEFYATMKDVAFEQTVGIDGGVVYVVRGGIRNNNDLVWVGRSPNVAAKLSAIRGSGYSTLITKDVYDSLNDSSKFGGSPLQNMWASLTWSAGDAYGAGSVYGSHWSWTP